MQICKLTRVQRKRGLSSSEEEEEGGVGTCSTLAHGISLKGAGGDTSSKNTNTLPSSSEMFARLPYMYCLLFLPTKADTGLGNKTRFLVSSRRGAHSSLFLPGELHKVLGHHVFCPEFMHWYQKTRRMSDTRNTPTIPMPSPPQSNIGVLPLRLCQFQPISTAQCQTCQHSGKHLWQAEKHLSQAEKKRLRIPSQ